MKIVGYSDRWSVAPGERIRFMVSTTHDRYAARIVRLFHGDPSPDGPGLKVHEVPTPVEGEYAGREQPYSLGSYGIVDPAPPVGRDFSIAAAVFPTTPQLGSQSILSCGSWGLFIDDGGELALQLGENTIRTGEPMRAFTWYSVTAHIDDGHVLLEQRPLRDFPGYQNAVSVEHDAPAPTPVRGPLVIGRGFNGKIADPALSTPSGELARWDFSQGIDSDRIVDASGNGYDGRLVNMPMRAVTGPSWRGVDVDFRRTPGEWNAVFFHDDDLEDAGWEPDFALDLPDDFPSGVYAAHLTAAEDEEWLPFFVRPPRDEARSPIAFLAPTLSYLAYANEHAALDNPVAVTDFNIWDYMQSEDHLAMNVPLLGLYDRHRDRVGVCYSSRLRPVVNMRPHYHLPLIRAAHQFPADLHLVDWLAEKGFEVDVITDEDLHEEGEPLLRRYRVVVTGSHPEYWTTPMLDALESWLEDAGGRLMYLGGNGFYWVTSVDPARPHVIEVRRGRRGTGTWRGEPGEDYHSTTGEPGGLWRDRGRPPQRYVGVGMATQGFDRALPYEREEASADARVAWIFDRVDEGPIGDDGLVLGGAGGLELDRMDGGLGTPPHALHLASSTGFSDSYQHVVEEVVSSDSKQGGTVDERVRGDMVFFELPNGGAVFSTGSIAWCGSLSHNEYDNAVSRITENVLRRFAADAPVNGLAAPTEVLVR
jgi:N,N-dimethylformamidase